MSERYPPAVWKGDGVSGGSYTSGPFKVVLHTTETRTLPGYNYGRYAPHMTYLPKKRQFIQHTSFMTAARALRNEAGGVQTNRDSAIQLEIVCYSALNIAARYTGGLGVDDLTADNLADIREFLDWVNVEFGVPLRWPEKQALSYSQANAPGFRMTGPEWDYWAGVCGHQHLPENTHWDPGALDWEALIGGDDMAILTDAEQEWLQDFIASTQAVNSGPTFPKYIIPWFRRQPKQTAAEDHVHDITVRLT